MNPYDLAEACIRSIENLKLVDLQPTISLEVKEGNPNSKERYPFGLNGPLGIVIMYGIPDGKDTVIFSSTQVLKFLVDHDVVSIDTVFSRTGLEL